MEPQDGELKLTKRGQPRRVAAQLPGVRRTKTRSQGAAVKVIPRLLLVICSLAPMLASAEGLQTGERSACKDRRFVE